MRGPVQTLFTRKRIRPCGSYTPVFLVLNTYLIMAFICLSVNGLRRKTHKYYSAFEDTDQFMDAIAHFTKLRVSNRMIAGRDFLNAKDLEDSDRDLLQFFITDYLKFHRINQGNLTRRLIFRPGNVGNGDRFECMLFAYWAAVLSKRVFLLDWDEPFPLSLFMSSMSGARIFLDHNEKNDSLSLWQRCTLPNCVLLSHEHLNGNHYEEALSSKTRTVYMHTHKVPLEVEKDFVERHIPKNTTSSMVKSFRGHEVFKRAVLHHVLRLSDSMKTDHIRLARGLQLTSGSINQKAKSSWRQKGMDDFLHRRARKYIGVHARLGLGVGEFGAARFKKAAGRMKDMAMCLASRAVRLAVMSGNPPVPIFLATDTTEFRGIFQQVVKGVSRGTVDVLFGNWSTIHVGKVLQRDMNVNGKGYGEPWESVWGGFMDLVLLGHAEHIVALYSGFPRLALSLGDAETLVELRNEICLAKR